MKWFLVLVIVGGLGYLAYSNKDLIQRKYEEMTKQSSSAGSSSPGADNHGQTPGLPPPPSTKPGFVSKVPGAAAPGKHLAPEGVYYMTERVSTTTSTGVAAVNPADKVTLVKKLPNNRLRVTNGEYDFDIKESQATNDLDLAREVEKKEFLAHGGQL